MVLILLRENHESRVHCRGPPAKKQKGQNLLNLYSTKERCGRAQRSSETPMGWGRHVGEVKKAVQSPSGPDVQNRVHNFQGPVSDEHA